MVSRCCCLAVCLLALLPARALLVDPLSIESLASEAEIIVQGKVLSKSCQRDATGRIYTKVELQVIEVWKGAVGTNPFLLVHGGGTLGEERSVVAGQVEYAVGEEIVAFLVRNQRGEGVTLGLAQGKFRIWTDSAKQTAFVSSPFHGVPLPASGQAARMNASGAAAPGMLKLSQLKARVLEVVR